MKKINKIFVILITSILFNSCFSLDQTPYDSLDATNVHSKKDADFWVNGMYSLLRDNVHGQSMYLADVQADFLNRTIIGSPSWNDIHTWELFTSSDKGTINIWNNYYLIIQNINSALEGVNKIIESGAETDIAGLNSDKGELLLGRAFCYSYLATHFCNAYNESSADTDLGLPLLYKTTKKDFPARSSLKQTYEFILSDIAQAETLLQNKTGSVGATSFTIDAVKALKARVLLYKNEWQQAYNVAKALVDANTYSLVTTQSELEGVWHNDDAKESITQIFAGIINGKDQEVVSATNDIYLDEASDYFNPGTSIYSPQAVPTQDFVNLYNTNDIRKNVYLEQKNVKYLGNTISLYLVNKYPNNPGMVLSSSSSSFWFGFGSNAYSYAHKPKLFRIAEMYLIVAEAAYKLGQTTDAQTYLDKLRKARGLENVTYTDIWQEIQDERNREFAFEGVRLIDIKRWGLSVVRKTPQNESIIMRDPASYYNELNISPDNYKMVWPLPPSDIILEEGKLKQNKGW